MITRRGWIFLLFIMLLLGAMMATGRALFLSMALMLILTAMISLGVAWSDRRKIRIALEPDPPEVPRGMTANIGISLHNSGNRDFGPVELAIRKQPLHDADEHIDHLLPNKRERSGWPDRSRLLLMRRSSGSLKLPVRIRHSGLYSILLDFAVGTDSFGLFRFAVLSAEEQSRLARVLAILPLRQMFIPPDELRAQLEQELNRRRVQLGADLDDLGDFHEQRPGDSLKRAHWKLSARLNTVMIKDFENPKQQETTLFLDVNATRAHQNWRIYYDAYADCVLYFADEVLGAGSLVRAIASADEEVETAVIRDPGGIRELEIMVAGLADRRPSCLDLGQMLKRETGTAGHLVVWMADYLTDNSVAGMLDYLAARRSLWVVLLQEPGQVMSQHELDLQKQLQSAGAWLVTREITIMPLQESDDRSLRTPVQRAVQ